MLNKYYKKIKDIFGSSADQCRGFCLPVDSRQDWTVLFLLFLILAFGLLAADIFLFYFGFNAPEEMSVIGESIQLNRPKLRKALDEWSGKEIQYNKILKEKEGIVDPSL